MSQLSISLFGRFCARHDGQPLRGLDAYKVQELLCYLLLHRNRPHPREVLAAVLWSDLPAAQSRKYLRQTLWQLQTALEEDDRPAGERLLHVESDWVQLNSQAICLDVAQFEQAFEPTRGVAGQKLDEARVRGLADVLPLYTGDLLEGWYQDWCLQHRERLQAMYLAILDKMMAFCEAQRAYEIGLSYGERILSYDRARERTHRQLMRLHYLGGDRTAALRQYERCVSALRDELDVKPAHRTVLLYEQIRADAISSSSAPAEGSAARKMPAAALTELLGRLKQLRAGLADIQSQLQAQIKAAEQALKE